MPGEVVFTLHSSSALMKNDIYHATSQLNNLSRRIPSPPLSSGGLDCGTTTSISWPIECPATLPPAVRPGRTGNTADPPRYCAIVRSNGDNRESARPKGAAARREQLPRDITSHPSYNCTLYTGLMTNRCLVARARPDHSCTSSYMLVLFFRATRRVRSCCFALNPAGWDATRGTIW